MKNLICTFVLLFSLSSYCHECKLDPKTQIKENKNVFVVEIKSTTGETIEAQVTENLRGAALKKLTIINSEGSKHLMGAGLETRPGTHYIIATNQYTTHSDKASGEMIYEPCTMALDIQTPQYQEFLKWLHSKEGKKFIAAASK